jgi:hypothetical protein
VKIVGFVVRVFIAMIGRTSLSRSPVCGERTRQEAKIDDTPTQTSFALDFNWGAP